MDRFKWGHTFYEVNDELLQKYAACENSAEVVAVQDAYLKQITEESRAGKDEGTVEYKTNI